jgi:hypothetical protein
MRLSEKEIMIQSQFEKLLPGVTLHPLRRGSEMEVGSCFYSIGPAYRAISSSRYYISSGFKFIHFTTLEAAKSIIQGKNVRLYNLNKLNDPREFSFAGDLLTFSQQNKADAKCNMFTISMCKPSILRTEIQTEFNMWRPYGGFGKGVGIEFDFQVNPPRGWKDYFLSRVFYGRRNRSNLIDAGQLIQKYKNEKPIIEFDLAPIIAFHKSNLYRLENEVRLLFDNRVTRLFSSTTYFNYRNEILAPIIKIDDEKSRDMSKEIKYLELPVYHRKIDNLSEQIPLPKITRIILGYDFKENFAETAKTLNNLAQESLEHPIKVERTRLIKYYYEQ